MKEKEKVKLEEFLRGMIEMVNSKLNRIESNLNAKLKRQGEVIADLERRIARVRSRTSSAAELKVDKSLLKVLSLPSEVIKPVEKVSKPKELTKTKKKS